MNWFKKLKLFPSGVNKTTNKKASVVPEGVWTKCEGCQSLLYSAELKRHLRVCPKCGYHNYISARERLNAFFDGELESYDITVAMGDVDRLKFKDTKKYKDRLSAAKQATVYSMKALA